jgi:quercetin dioxygenase-like cupin family protein
MSEYFPDVESRKYKQLVEGIKARTFWKDRIMLALVDLEPNAVLPYHHHPHEQAGVVLEGEMTLTVGEETKLVRPGDLYLIPGDVPHSAKVGSMPTRLVDIFSPVREEYKE